MRIVARQTADSRIIRVVTLAAGQAIRLEANVGNAQIRLHSNFCPGAMTLPAEVRHLLGSEFVWLGFFLVRIQVVAVEQQHGGKMRFGTLVAVYALHAWCHFLQSELPSGCGVGGVAPKAAEFIVLSHQPSCRFGDVAGCGALRSQRRTEAFHIPEIAYAAFIKLSVFGQDESLADRGTGPHDPANRKGERSCSIGDGVIALRALSLDAVGVLAYGHRKHRVIDERFGIFNRFECAPHRGVWLRLCLGVTLGARGCSRRGRLRSCGYGQKQIQKMTPYHHNSRSYTRPGKEFRLRVRYSLRGICFVLQCWPFRSLRHDRLLVDRVPRLMTIPAIGPITPLTWAFDFQSHGVVWNDVLR